MDIGIYLPHFSSGVVQWLVLVDALLHQGEGHRLLDSLLVRALGEEGVSITVRGGR